MQHEKAFAAYNGILQAHTVAFTAIDGRAFVRIDGRRIYPVRSRDFRSWFYDQVYTAFDTIPSAQAFGSVRRHLEAQAARDPDNCGIRVSRRVDTRGDHTFLLDLGGWDGDCVEITAEGWRTTHREDATFENPTTDAALPPPEPPDPNTLQALRALLNLTHTADWLHVTEWLLSALRRGIPQPILILRGPTGSGKSFAVRVLRALVDPSRAQLHTIPSTVRALHNLALNHWVLAFDHVSHLKPPIAEALCQLATGISVPLREEGTRDPVHLWLRRPIVMTVTDDFVLPPDLATRALIVTLPPLTAATRRTESHLAATLENMVPKILGALCDALANILRTTAPASEAMPGHKALAPGPWLLAPASEASPRFPAPASEASHKTPALSPQPLAPASAASLSYRYGEVPDRADYRRVVSVPHRGSPLFRGAPLP
jgi:hypothetical protein